MKGSYNVHKLICRVIVSVTIQPHILWRRTADSLLRKTGWNSRMKNSIVGFLKEMKLKNGSGERWKPEIASVEKLGNQVVHSSRLDLAWLLAATHPFHPPASRPPQQHLQLFSNSRSTHTNRYISECQSETPRLGFCFEREMETGGIGPHFGVPTNAQKDLYKRHPRPKPRDWYIHASDEEKGHENLNSFTNSTRFLGDKNPHHQPFHPFSNSLFSLAPHT